MTPRATPPGSASPRPAPTPRTPARASASATVPVARRSRPAPPPARGSALLVAMVLLTVVATLAAGMVWQQWQAVQVETAERARAQSTWLAQGATDWARLILREDLVVDGDARRGGQDFVDSPSEAWAQPLAEARLSTFLAVDREHNAEADAGPELFLSGHITDAQARYNLRNLLAEGKVQPAQLAVLQRLCASAGLGADVARQLADGLLAASLAADPAAPLPPQRLEDLAWLGLDEAALARLAPLVTLLPVATPLNLNTAERAVIAGVLGIDAGSADRLVQARNQSRTPHQKKQGFASLALAGQVLGPAVPLNEAAVDVKSAFFEVHGRLRQGAQVVEEHALVERRGGPRVLLLQRVREARVLAPP